MLRGALLIAACLGLGFAPAPFVKKRDVVGPALKGIQGKWERVGYNIDGRAGAVKPEEQVAEVEGNQMRLSCGPAYRSYDITFHPPTSSGAHRGDIDVVAGRTPLKGIYRLLGGELTVCFDYTGSGPRPRSFAAQEGVLIETYRRKKP